MKNYNRQLRKFPGPIISGWFRWLKIWPPAHGTPMPVHQSDLAGQLLKDPYLFDFLTLEEPFHERELEGS